MAAAIPLGKILIENDLKKERKRSHREAQAIGVFLNVETQHKFMKVSGNMELQQENKGLREEIKQLKEDLIEAQQNSEIFSKWWAELINKNGDLGVTIMELQAELAAVSGS